MNWNIAILGSGGREHAHAVKLAESSLVGQIFLIPGNDGIPPDNKIINVGAEFSSEELVLFCRDQKIDWVVPGSEELLARGLGDMLESAGIKCFGPDRRSSLLEASKIFSKQFMLRHKIPTANAVVAHSFSEAFAAIDACLSKHHKVVIKAQGLWAGKGVLVTGNAQEALDFTRHLFKERLHEGILVEEPLKGRELSYFVMTNGEDSKFLGVAMDHKRLLENDQGPNTGGMGAFVPQGWPDALMMKKIHREIVAPTIKGLRDEGMSYFGVIFFGLMIDADNVNVIEYNVRMGDPETQAILPVMQEDLALYMASCLKLSDVVFSQLPDCRQEKSCVHVVATSQGYARGNMLLGRPIKIGSLPSNTRVYFAAVAKKDQSLTNSGGRVLGISAMGKNTEEARELAYQALEEISFDGMHARQDIAINLPV